MFRRIAAITVSLIVIILFTTGCSFFDSSSSEENTQPAPSMPLPPGVEGLVGASPTPTPAPSVSVPPEDLITAKQMADGIRGEVMNNYKGIFVTSASTAEFSAGIVVRYIVMFAVPDYFFNPQTVTQEKEAEGFQGQANAALVDLLKKTITVIVPEVKLVKAVEIVVIYPNATGVDLVASTDALLSLPPDASAARWLGMLAVTPLVFAPIDTKQ